jgi:hypothetical protein
VIVLLLLIVRTIDGGDPFVLANARRLQWIAFVVGAGGLLAQGLGDQARNELLVSSAAGGIVRYAFEFSFPRSSPDSGSSPSPRCSGAAR